MGELLKEAIADAKAIRETALANARLALEEAFTPKLQSMLDAKIRNEVEGDEGAEDDIEISDEEIPVEEPAPEAPVEEPAVPAEAPPVEAPVEAPPVEEPAPEETPGEEDLDLEAIIKELEDEAAEGEELELGAEDEVEVEGKIAKDGPNLKKITPAAPELAGNTVKPGVEVSKTTPITEESVEEWDEHKPKHAVSPGSVEEAEVNPKASAGIQYNEAKEDEEEVNIDEILRELAEEDDEESIDEAKKKEEEEDLEEALKKTKEDLEEHKKVVTFLRAKLNEVNLLNAKLLFTNKLFRAHTLNNSQKMKVIENFDRAKSLREVKLVYATIAESLSETGLKKSTSTKVQKITEGLASKATAKTVIKEVKEVEDHSGDLVSPESAERLKKLARITKK